MSEKESNTEEESEIRKRARTQASVENADADIRKIMSEMVQMIKTDAKKTNNLQTKQKALKQIRMASQQIREEADRVRTISEYSVQELVDELYRILEEKQRERVAEEN